MPEARSSGSGDTDRPAALRDDIEADAGRAFEVLRAGGIAIAPMDVGYSIIGGSAGSL